MKKWIVAATMPLALIFSAAMASEGVKDVIHLEDSHVSDDVMMAYVQNAPTPFDPTAEEIDTMQKAGVPSTVIVAMIERGKELRGVSADVASNEPVAPATSPSNTNGIYQSPDPTTPPPVYKDGPDVEVSAFYAPPEGEVNLSFFYGSLAPYGTWHHVGERYVFRPSIAVTVTDWHPYSDSGHWVNTDYGWYWESDYPWGWAAFHYGRWYEDTTYGWCWVPDTTWGPAWVDWRRSDDYYGWAPLPPEARFEAGVGFSFQGKNVGFDFHFGLNERAYAFVPSRSFLDRDIAHVRVPRTRTKEVYNNTTIINNTYVYNDNRVINRGVPVQTVAKATNQQVETVQVTDMKVAQGQTFQRGEVKEGRTIQAYRPTVKNEAPAAPEKAAQDIKVKREEAIRRNPQRNAGRQNAEGGAATDPNATQNRKLNEAEAQKRLEAEKANRRNANQAGAAEKTTGAANPATETKTQQAEEARRKQETERKDAESTRAQEKLNAEKAQRDSNTRGKAEQQAEEARQKNAADRKAAEEAQARQKLNEEKAQRESEAKAKGQQRADEARRNQDQARKAAEEAQARQKLNEEKARNDAESKAKAERDAGEARAKQQAEEARRNQEQGRKASDEARQNAEKAQRDAENRAKAEQPKPQPQPKQSKQDEDKSDDDSHKRGR